MHRLTEKNRPRAEVEWPSQTFIDKPKAHMSALGALPTFGGFGFDSYVALPPASKQLWFANPTYAASINEHTGALGKLAVRKTKLRFKPTEDHSQIRGGHILQPITGMRWQP